jgi:Tol biopolymer transport system component
VDGEPVGLAEVGGWTGAGGSWSPDGEEIVFIKLSPQGRAIWKIPVSSGDPIQLTPGGILSHSRTGLSFSPDGREIAFTSTKDGETNIWTMPASGGDAHQITLTPGYDTFLSYSPDGRRIAFSSSDSGSADIWAVPSSGGMPVRLVDWPTLEWGPDWSPDGQQIAFVSNRAQTGEVVDDIWYLWLLPVGGGEAVYLTEGFTPDWSPAGGEILFAHQGDIWKIPAAGGEPSRLLETPKSEEFWPRFSADGSKILFTRSVGTGGADIWIADVSGI